jgi:ketosteroid isomerase-like protein
VTSYCYAVDKLGDVDGLLSLFTEDAVFDLSPIGLPKIQGNAAIGAFFVDVFEMMTHHAHYVANFTVQRLEGGAASTRAYVMGMGNARDGSSVLVYVDYHLDCVRTASAGRSASSSKRL